MFSLRDLLFFLISTLAFFILLIIFNFLDLKQNLNLFISALIYGTANSLYILYFSDLKKYISLMIAFFVLILFVGNSEEILSIYTAILMPFTLLLVFRNREIFKSFIRTD